VPPTMHPDPVRAVIKDINFETDNASFRISYANRHPTMGLVPHATRAMFFTVHNVCPYQN
jgi:hypothetical protein